MQIKNNENIEKLHIHPGVYGKAFVGRFNFTCSRSRIRISVNVPSIPSGSGDTPIETKKPKDSKDKRNMLSPEWINTSIRKQVRTVIVSNKVK